MYTPVIWEYCSTLNFTMKYYIFDYISRIIVLWKSAMYIAIRVSFRGAGRQQTLLCLTGGSLTTCLEDMCPSLPTTCNWMYFTGFTSLKWSKLCMRCLQGVLRGYPRVSPPGWPVCALLTGQFITYAVLLSLFHVVLVPCSTIYTMHVPCPWMHTTGCTAV